MMALIGRVIEATDGFVSQRYLPAFYRWTRLRRSALAS
jgi:hypothetical protein